MNAKHPMQPMEYDDDGVLRFKENAIVVYLAHGRLNELARMRFSKADWQQLAQLIGYSQWGYSELSYVDEEAWAAAEKEATKARRAKERQAVRDRRRKRIQQS